MLEAMVPISDKEGVRQNYNRARLLFHSLNFFWKGDRPLKVHVVLPDDEMRKFMDFMSNIFSESHNIDVSLIRESDLLPNVAQADTKIGYAKQMLLKLGAGDLTHGEFFLTLDADIVACKHFDESTFFINGRAATAWAAPTLQQWWYESGKLLDFEVTPEFFNKKRIHVTPQILSSEICRILKQYLSNKSGKDWDQHLLDNYTGNHPHIWTEYTLFYIMAIKSGVFDQYYLPFEEITRERKLHCVEQNIWGANTFDRWSPEKALNGENDGHFIVMQSMTANQIGFDHMRKVWLDALEAVYPGSTALLNNYSA